MKKSYFRTNFTNSQDEAEDDDEWGSYTVGEMMTKTITEANEETGEKSKNIKINNIWRKLFHIRHAVNIKHTDSSYTI